MEDIDIAQVATVEVDRDLCTGAAACLVYPFYEIDDESKAVLLTSNGLNSDDPRNTLAQGGKVGIENLRNDGGISPDELRKMVLESAKICPFNAIIVRDENGKILWPPAQEF